MVQEVAHGSTSASCSLRTLCAAATREMRDAMRAASSPSPERGAVVVPSVRSSPTGESSDTNNTPPRSPPPSLAPQSAAGGSGSRERVALTMTSSGKHWAGAGAAGGGTESLRPWRSPAATPLGPDLTWWQHLGGVASTASPQGSSNRSSPPTSPPQRSPSLLSDLPPAFESPLASLPSDTRLACACWLFSLVMQTAIADRAAAPGGTIHQHEPAAPVLRFSETAPLVLTLRVLIRCVALYWPLVFFSCSSSLCLRTIT